MVESLYRLHRFRYVRKTWNELISSGQYNHFGDVALRELIDRIVELQDTKERQSENTYVYTQDIIDPWLTKHYDVWLLHSILRDDTEQRDDIPKDIGDIDITAILADRSFRNILAYRLLFLTGEIRFYDEIAKDYKLLQKMLAIKLQELEE
jgi:hypothetical protein